MKNGCVIPFQRQDDKQNAKNYCPVSLLSVFGKKTFQRVIYNEM